MWSGGYRQADNQEETAVGETGANSGDDRRFAAALGVVYLLALVVVTLSHELWRDEMQAWNIARASSTPIQLLHNMRYETHPPLWHLCLFVLSRFTSSPLAMQLFHVALATGAAYLFLRYAPLSRLKRGLFVFGFFPFYEYGAIARCYSLGLLFTFAFCALFPQRAKRLVWMCLLLFGLSMSSAYALVMALSLGAALVAAWVIDRRAGQPWKVPIRQAVAGIALVLVGFAVAKIRIAPPPDSMCGTPVLMQTTVEAKRLAFALGQLPHAFLYDFGLLPALKTTVPAIALLAALILLFRRNAVALVFFSVSTTLMLVSIYVNKTTAIWHTGHFAIGFAVLLWLSGTYAETAASSRESRRPAKQGPGRLAEVFVVALLAYQVAPNLVASYLDLRFPFSNGKAVAAYLQETGRDRMPLAAIYDEGPVTIAGYLNKPIYCLVTGREAMWVNWTIKRGREFDAYAADDSGIARSMAAVIRRARGPVVLIRSSARRGYVHAFQGAVGGFIQDCPDLKENFWIYICSGRQTACAGSLLVPTHPPPERRPG